MRNFLTVFDTATRAASHKHSGCSLLGRRMRRSNNYGPAVRRSLVRSVQLNPSCATNVRFGWSAVRSDDRSAKIYSSLVLHSDGASAEGNSSASVVSDRRWATVIRKTHAHKLIRRSSARPTHAQKLIRRSRAPAAMPLRREPPPLLSLSERAVAESLSARWLEEPAFLERRWEAVRRLLEAEVPRPLLPPLVARLVDAFSRQGRAAAAPFLVRAVAARGLSALDLSPLVRLGCAADDDALRLFEEALAAAAAETLGELRRLSLATHGNDFTLPSCGAAPLRAVALGCPRLRVLDVSCCPRVTDAALLPLADGCPLLERLLVFGTAVTAEGAALLLGRLPELRLLGLRDVCAPLTLLHRGRRREPLKLTHVCGVGDPGAAPRRLRFSAGVAAAVASLCPALTNLRARVTDADVCRLRFPALRSLELVFHVGAPASPGEGTAAFLRGPQGRLLSCLTLVCDALSADQLLLVAAQCRLLRQLWLKCNDLRCDAHWRPPPPPSPAPAAFARLESLYARVSRADRPLPARLLAALLRDAAPLASLQLFSGSSCVGDAWLRDVLTAVPTSSLTRLMVAVPGVNDASGGPQLGGLTAASARLALELCPRLRTLGNLVAWNVGHGQYKDLRDRLRAANYDCEVVYRRARVA